MADWVKATIDNSKAMVWVNLSVATKMERPSAATLTKVVFVDNTYVDVAEQPDELLAKRK